MQISNSSQKNLLKILKVREKLFFRIKSVGESETKCWTGRNLDIAFANKINELIKAVKLLNNKIKE